MKALGFLLLLAGWGIAVTAVALLAGGVRIAFVLSGIGVEAMGLGVVIRAHPILHGEQE